MSKALTKNELDERIAILKRFKSLLEQQRGKFQEYLLVLENQHGKIEQDDTDSLVAHTELENQIVKSIASLQKVIVPMQSLYQKSGAGIGIPDSDSVVQIQTDLADLQRRVLAQNERNRILLQAHMNQLKHQITTVVKMNPYRGRRSIYAERGSSGTLVSVEG